ncbi:unnamed protein product, partial [Didymodactylos carnosus]
MHQKTEVERESANEKQNQMSIAKNGNFNVEPMEEDYEDDSRERGPINNRTNNLIGNNVMQSSLSSQSKISCVRHKDESSTTGENTSGSRATRLNGLVMSVNEDVNEGCAIDIKEKDSGSRSTRKKERANPIMSLAPIQKLSN